MSDGECVHCRDVDEASVSVASEGQSVSCPRGVCVEGFFSPSPADVDVSSAVDYRIDGSVDTIQGRGVGDIGIEFGDGQIGECGGVRSAARDSDYVVFFLEGEPSDIISEEPGCSSDD